MNALAGLGFVALTALSMRLGAALVGRCGGRQLLVAAARRAVPVSCGVLAALLAARLAWFWPFGLLTPVVLGVAVALLARRGVALPAVVTPALARAASPRGTWLGAALGATAAALGWLLLPLCFVPLALSPRTQASTARPVAVLLALADVAHRGFLRHLPVVGELSDEVAALLVVLRATPSQQQQLAAAHGWQHLAELPAMQRALVDSEVLADIELLRDGSWSALWRLQRHPRVVELAGCAEFQELCAGLRPTALAVALGAR